MIKKHWHSFTKTTLFALAIILSSCTLNTTIERDPRICRQYYLMTYASIEETDDAYVDLAAENKISLASEIKVEPQSLSVTYFNFYYEGNFDLRIEYQNGDIIEREGTYTMDDDHLLTIVTFSDGEVAESVNTFSRKSDGDTLITYLRVPYTITLGGVEQELFLWFFNGIFVACPFLEE
jgi:hypothetical protein